MTIETIKTDFTNLIDELLLHIKEIILMTLPLIPRYPSLTNQIIQFNEYVKEKAEHHQMKVLDLYQALKQNSDSCYER